MSANLMSLARSGGKFLKLFGDRKMVKTMPTARDYVQDGLVAMWDGIENAGWGVHDTTIVGRRNLIGNGDIALSYPHEWDVRTLINYGDSIIYSLIGFDIGSVLRACSYVL